MPRGLRRLAARWRRLVHLGLNLLTNRWRLMRRRLRLRVDRRRLVNLRLLADRSGIGRVGGRYGLGHWVSTSRLARSSLRLHRALGEGWSRTGAHRRCERMNLFGVDRLHLHASGRGVLAGGLDTQSL